jgi:hypothetical protein
MRSSIKPLKIIFNGIGYGNKEPRPVRVAYDIKCKSQPISEIPQDPIPLTTLNAILNDTPRSRSNPSDMLLMLRSESSEGVIPQKLPTNIGQSPQADAIQYNIQRTHSVNTDVLI